MKEILLIFGARLKALRKERKISQKDLADEIGIHWSYVGLLERGDRVPSLIALYNIASFFGIKPADMISEGNGDQELNMRQKELVYFINEATTEDLDTLYRAAKVIIKMGKKR